MSGFYGIWLISIKKLKYIYILREWGKQDNQKSLAEKAIIQIPKAATQRDVGRPFKGKRRSSTKGNEWHMVGRKETQQTQSIVNKESKT